MCVCLCGWVGVAVGPCTQILGAGFEFFLTDQGVGGGG